MSLPSVLDRRYVRAESSNGRRTLKKAKTKHSRRSARRHIDHALELLDREEFPRRDLEIDTPVPVRRPRTTLQMFIRQRNLLPAR